MKIGIIVAMGKELALLASEIADKKDITLDGINFIIGKIDKQQIIAMQCGIGKVNAALGTLTLIENFHPDIIINSGVAGGTGHGANIGDVVMANGIAYHDVWCGPGTQWGQADGCPRVFECQHDTKDLAEKLKIKTGLIASGDIFISRPEEVQHILSLYPECIAVDMESAAIAQTCYLKKVPMLCLRVVSDTPGAENNIDQYENFWGEAPKNTFRAVSTLISML